MMSSCGRSSLIKNVLLLHCGCWLQHGTNSYGTISKMFAIGKSTGVSIYKGLCMEIKRNEKVFVTFPVTTSKIATTYEKFKIYDNYKNLQVTGAIDFILNFHFLI